MARLSVLPMVYFARRRHDHHAAQPSARCRYGGRYRLCQLRRPCVAAPSAAPPAVSRSLKVGPAPSTNIPSLLPVVARAKEAATSTQLPTLARAAAATLLS